jgi:predicted alpha/beta superfamily hydrolase
MSESSPAQLPGARQFDVTSKITGRIYRIYVSAPLGPPPAAGYPVLYVLDAATAFPIAASQVTLASLSGGRPIIVVGVGYPNVLATMRLRGRDLTPWPADPFALDNSPGSKAEDFGGGEDFHRFMIEELRPLIAKTFPIDPHGQALMGYSLGGLFTLNVMFHHPDAYRTYVAGSPSIWYDSRKVLDGEAAFETLVQAGKVAPRLLITSDGWEQADDAPNLPASGKARDEALAGMKVYGMVDNARDLAARLKAVKGPAGYEVRYVLFPEETHLTGIPASTSRGVAFVTAP